MNSPQPNYGPLTLFLSDGGNAFSRNFLEETQDLRKIAGSVEEIKYQLELLEIPYQPIKARTLRGIEEVVGVQGIGRKEHGNTLLECGWTLRDNHTRKAMTSEDLAMPAVANEKHLKAVRRVKGHSQATGYKQKGKEGPPKRNHTDRALIADEFVKAIEELKQKMPEAEGLEGDALSEVILAHRRQPADGRIFTQSYVLTKALYDGTNARWSDVYQFLNKILAENDLTESVSTGSMGSAFVENSHFKLELLSSLKIMLEKQLVPKRMTVDAFTTIWSFFKQLPNTRQRTDTSLNMDIDRLCKEYGIKNVMLTREQPEPLPGNSKLDETAFGFIRGGKRKSSPRTLDQLMCTLSLLKRNGKLLIPRERLEQLANDHGFPYDAEKGYCIASYEDVLNDHLMADPPLPLSIMLRELRMCREVNLGVIYPELQKIIGSLTGVEFIESPSHFERLPSHDVLEKILALYASILRKNGVELPSCKETGEAKLPEDHIVAFRNALKRGYPSDRPIKAYQAEDSDPWKKFYPVNVHSR